MNRFRVHQLVSNQRKNFSESRGRPRQNRIVDLTARNIGVVLEGAFGSPLEDIVLLKPDTYIELRDTRRKELLGDVLLASNSSPGVGNVVVSEVAPSNVKTVQRNHIPVLRRATVGDKQLSPSSLLSSKIPWTLPNGDFHHVGMLYLPPLLVYPFPATSTNAREEPDRVTIPLLEYLKTTSFSRPPTSLALTLTREVIIAFSFHLSLPGNVPVEASTNFVTEPKIFLAVDDSPDVVQCCALPSKTQFQRIWKTLADEPSIVKAQSLWFKGDKEVWEALWETRPSDAFTDPQDERWIRIPSHHHLRNTNLLRKPEYLLRQFQYGQLELYP